jgi:hypothetical protein
MACLEASGRNIAVINFKKLSAEEKLPSQQNHLLSSIK